MSPNSNQLLLITACSSLLPTTPEICSLDLLVSDQAVSSWCLERPAGKKALVCSWCYFYQPLRSHAGQILLSTLRQPLNSKFRNAASDNLSPHWSWQYECSHGAKWRFREWGYTSFLVLLTPSYQSPQFPRDCSNCKTWSSRAPLMLPDFSGTDTISQILYSGSKLANCRVLQKLWKNQIQLVLLIFNEEKLQSISSPELGLFSAKSSQCKASTALGIWHFVVVVGSCLWDCASGCPRCSSRALKMIAFAVAVGWTSSKQRGSWRVLLI